MPGTRLAAKAYVFCFFFGFRLGEKKGRGWLGGSERGGKNRENQGLKGMF